MKPAWDELGDDFANSKTVVIGDVDCTVPKHEKLCKKIGVEGYPTVRYFTDKTPRKGAAYEGERDYAALKQWADENLGPSCDNDHNDLCSEEQRAILGKYNKMTESERKAIISKADAAVASAEAKFNKEVEKLQAKAEAIEAEKTAQIKVVQTKELRLIKSIRDPADAQSAKGEKKKRGGTKGKK